MTRVRGGAPKALCLMRDASLQPTLRRSLSSAGFEVEFSDTLNGHVASSATLVIADSPSRRDLGVDALSAVVGAAGSVILIGDDLADPEVPALLRTPPVSHIISDVAALDDHELLTTSSKLLSDDIFGVEKYLSWGVKATQAIVTDYDDKAAAVASVGEHAASVGARRAVVARIERVTDELLMNAIYDAPEVHERNLGTTRRIRSALSDPQPVGKPALCRVASDGRRLAVSVRDDYGELEQAVLVDSYIRARDKKGRPREDIEHGAGLGLYFVLCSVTQLIVNIAPNRCTEVICLFDLRLNPRDLPSITRSLHIFTSTDTQAAQRSA